jgi:hypothetical protein
MALRTPRGMFPGGNTGQAGIIADIPGVVATATLLPATVNRVDTVAGAADGVILPSALPGSVIWVINGTATSMQVFAQQSNDANPLQTTGNNVADQLVAAADSTLVAGSTGLAQAGHIPAMYVCAVVGVWKQYLCVS